MGAVRSHLERALSIAVLLVAIAAAGCGFSSQPVEPLVVGTQQYFTLEWRVSPRGSQRLVSGHIRNEWGFTATNVRLLVDAIEPPDRVVSQRIVWLGGDVTPGTRAYFQATMPPAPTYRVRVFSFDWVQSAEMFSR
jgi:hypothetical protein